MATPALTSRELALEAAIAFAFLGPGADFWLSSDEAIATARVSKGDGGWVMAKCAECMLGECSIAFREAETVFELRCPAPQRLEAPLPLEGPSLP